MNLTAKHYLDIYKTRKSMQDDGVTNPSDEIKLFTSTLVERLSTLEENEEIDLVEVRKNVQQFVIARTGEVLGEIDSNENT